MRFLMKARIEELEQYCDTYKDFELSFSLDDIHPEHVKKLKKLTASHGIRISAIHCPGLSGPENDLSICEIMTSEHAREILNKTCKFAVKICENSSESNSGSKPVIVILRDGCRKSLELPETAETECERRKWYRQSLGCLDDKLISHPALKIGIQSVPARPEDPGSFGCSKCPVRLSAGGQPQDSDSIGRVIDICQIIAEKCRLHKEDSFDHYFSDYMKRFDKSNILLFRWSNPDPQTDILKEMSDETRKENPIFDAVFEYCMEHHRSVPITLEAGGMDHQEAARRFDSIMIRRSRLHTRPGFKEKIRKSDQELFDFFDNLYRAFTADTETEAEIGKLFHTADKIRTYVLANYKSSPPYPLGFQPGKQELDIHRFQIRAYVYYMRYMHAAVRLLKHYEEMQKDFDFAMMLKNYMFHDTLEELKFDGLVGYFNLPWLMTEDMTLYHFYDGYEGETVSYGTFQKEIARCMEHIVSPQLGSRSEVMSFGKAFGRCALKYYAPPGSDGNYTIRIVKTPVNCFYNGKQWIPLQAAPRTDSFVNSGQNFIIDFSNYYFGRGDAVSEASFLELYSKATGKEDMNREKAAPIYDQEIHIKNANGIQWRDYRLNLDEMLLLLIFYKYLISSKDHTVDDPRIPADIREILEQIDFNRERELCPDTGKHDSYFENKYALEEKPMEKVGFHKIYEFLPGNIKDYEKACDWLGRHPIKEY